MTRATFSLQFKIQIIDVKPETTTVLKGATQFDSHLGVSSGAQIDVPLGAASSKLKRTACKHKFNQSSDRGTGVARSFAQEINFESFYSIPKNISDGYV